MARETRAQREAREEAERQAQWEEFLAEYPRRFAKVLYGFTMLDASGVRHNGEFYDVQQLDDETYHFSHDYVAEVVKVTPPVNQNWQVLYALESLERSVQGYYDEKAEQTRKDQVRTTALNKLNAEERELLGL
ncbi:hypothetical protein [Flavobacterium sp.]|uniref:hypothetical protein n=1 Tax=Flavobacterium sp. TaxID=239 RepID=UPI0037BFEDD7